MRGPPCMKQTVQNALHKLSNGLVKLKKKIDFCISYRAYLFSWLMVYAIGFWPVSIING
jgi:hypothetical protein